MKGNQMAKQPEDLKTVEINGVQVSAELMENSAIMKTALDLYIAQLKRQIASEKDETVRAARQTKLNKVIKLKITAYGET